MWQLSKELCPHTPWLQCFSGKCWVVRLDHCVLRCDIFGSVRTLARLKNICTFPGISDPRSQLLTPMPSAIHSWRDLGLDGVAQVGVEGHRETQMFCRVFSIALIRNVFPEDGLWPGSEPNVNILAEASLLNRMEMVWGMRDLKAGVEESGKEELGEGRVFRHWLQTQSCPGTVFLGVTAKNWL